MFYVFDLGGHELHGPFMTRDKAHRWAAIVLGKPAYSVYTDSYCQQRFIRDSVPEHLVPERWR